MKLTKNINYQDSSLFQHQDIDTNLFNGFGSEECELREKHASGVVAKLKKALLTHNYSWDDVSIFFPEGKNVKLATYSSARLYIEERYCESYDWIIITFKHTSPVLNSQAANLINNLIQYADEHFYEDEDTPFIHVQYEIDQLNLILELFSKNQLTYSISLNHNPDLDIIKYRIECFDYEFHCIYSEDFGVPELKFKLINNYLFIEYTYPANSIFPDGGGKPTISNSWILISELDFKIAQQLITLNKLSMGFRNHIWIPKFISCIEYKIFGIDTTPKSNDEYHNWDVAYSTWLKLFRDEQLKKVFEN